MTRKQHFAKLIARIGIFTLIFALPACSDDDNKGFIIGGGDGDNNAGYPTTAAEKRMEVPEMLPGNRFIAHWSKEGKDSVMTFCLEYSPDDYHSRWVAFRFDDKTRAKNVSRKDYSIRPQYPRDPLLTAGINALADDASFNGYDHGHLCASADRLYSRTANDNTFFMTNMSPQISQFNAPYWSEYEGHVQKLGRDRNFADTLYVVKGGTITPGNILGRTAGGKIVIPKYYFMALLKVKGNSYSAIAFWMEHKSYGRDTPSSNEMAAHTISIDELEEKTGINFFHRLPDTVERLVEQQNIPNAWNL